MMKPTLTLVALVVVVSSPTVVRAQLADPLISELMAVNRGALLDEDGESPDWIEVHNPAATPVDLEGWFLTDDRDLLRKWRFPAVRLEADGYLVVFASGKDRRVPGAELHTNFRLSGTGEYVALIRPDGTTAHHFAPGFPRQREGFSFGIGQEISNDFLVAEGAPCRTLVPLDDALGASWRGAAEPFDDSGWIEGETAVGYELSRPGFLVRALIPGTEVRSLAVAEGIVDAADFTTRAVSENSTVINHFNTGGDGHFPGNRAFPGTTIGEGVDHFVVEATATLTFDAAGAWTFGVSSDDGFGLDITGEGVDYHLEFPGTRGPGDSLGSVDIPRPGTYDLRLVFFEAGGGSELELFAAPGLHEGFSPAFRLVGDPSLGILARAPAAGEGRSSGFPTFIGTNLVDELRGVATSAYVRIPFEIDDPARFESLTLRARYDDGFIAFLNGVEIVRRNAPGGEVAHDAVALTDRSERDAVRSEPIDVSEHLELLAAGSNVLALHGLNDRIDSEEFLLGASLAEVTINSQVTGFFREPTPGQPNSEVFTGFVADTSFSHDRGFYDEPFEVTISSETEGAEIWYTTNGSPPGPGSGSLYDGPIRIDTTTVLQAAAFFTDFVPTNVDAQTYVFLDDVLRQTGEGFPSQWGEASADYEMDPDVVDDPAYRDTIRDDLLSIPSFSIAMRTEDLFGPSGIYSNSRSSGVAWERRGSAELFYPEGVEGPGGDTRGFQIVCGVRMQGGASRSPNVRKHSFRLLFKGVHGPTKLRYPLFGDGATEEFDTVVLRAGFNNSWVGGQHGSAQYLRDEWIRRTQLAMGHPSGHGRFVHLYVNGLYWGLHNLVERPSAPFASAYLGGEKEDWDVLNSGEAIDGSNDTWQEAHALAQAGLESAESYAAIQDFVDVPNLIDYMMVNFYGGNRDWDGHNWYAGRRRQPGAGYKFFSWDAERTLEDLGVNRTGLAREGEPSGIYSALRANADFRVLFSDHVQRHCFHGGPLTPEICVERYRELADGVHGAIVGESARWGDKARSTPYTRDVEWVRERDRILGNFLPARTAVLVEQFRAAGLYQLDAPFLSRRGGRIEPGFEFGLAAEVGTVYYTLDGSDPRLPGGAIAPTAVEGPEGQSRSTTRLVRAGAEVRVLVPENGDLGLDWVDPDFDDSSWREGRAGIGYEDGSGYEDEIETDVSEMHDGNTSAYIRLEFDVDPDALDIEAIDRLTLKMKYDDGFAAFLNGVRVVSANAPVDLQWNSDATSLHDDGEAVVFIPFDITGSRDALRAGRNVLAIQGLNDNPGSSDFLIEPELDTVEIFGVRDEERITIEETTRVLARTFDGKDWSALEQALFHLDVPLRITELMYHPAELEQGNLFRADDLEFIELQNIGSSSIDLGGYRLAGGIDFEFPADTVIAPDAVMLLVRDVEGFFERYRSLDGVVGEYSGRLGNSGDSIRLEGAFGEPILEFEYSDQWIPETDGQGRSLVVIDRGAPPESWGDAASWQASETLHGTPGVVDADPEGGGWQLVGNLNGDETLNLSDAVSVLLHLFSTTEVPLPCEGDSIVSGGNEIVADFNADGGVNLSDAVGLLSYLFQGGPPSPRGTGCVRVVGCSTICPE